jgi:hypothetical protein
MEPVAMICRTQPVWSAVSNPRQYVGSAPDLPERSKRETLEPIFPAILRSSPGGMARLTILARLAHNNPSCRISQFVRLTDSTMPRCSNSPTLRGRHDFVARLPAKCRYRRAPKDHFARKYHHW